MFFLQFEVLPNPCHRNSPGDVGGAFVNCWIKCPTATEAKIRAKQQIESEGWLLRELLEIRRVSARDYDVRDKAWLYYQQAKADGNILVFHTYPLAENGDEGNELDSPQ